MKKWLHDRPWIWLVVFLGAVVLASVATVIVAEMNRPELVKRPPAAERGE